MVISHNYGCECSARFFEIDIKHFGVMKIVVLNIFYRNEIYYHIFIPLRQKCTELLNQ